MPPASCPATVRRQANGRRRWKPSAAISRFSPRDLRQAIKEGTPLAEAVKTAGRSEAPNWALFDEYNERNATAAYAELEWE